jgi:hypothetical protein
VRGLALGIAALLAAASLQVGAEQPPAMGRHMPYYPGLYLHTSLLHDARDRSFDAQGSRRDSVAPQTGGESRFPLTQAVAAFEWHFPMFEAYAWPYVSTRTHMARVTLRYADTRTAGPLAEFAADPDRRLENAGDGVGNIYLEFGSFLLGASDWRQRADVPFALLLKAGVDTPVGVYDRSAPNNVGTNTWAYDAEMGAHWRPWRGALIDAGLGWRTFSPNHEPMFGGLAPARQGDQAFWNVSLAHRLSARFYAVLHGDGFRGNANRYRNPRFTTTAPEPPPQSDNFPTPGTYRDNGTRLSTAGASLYWFATQRWLGGLHYAHPLSGRSGEFDVPYTNRTPAGCMTSATTCQTSDGDTVRADGLGPARVYASDRFTLTLSYNFGLGDAFTCVGCRE